MIFINMRMRQGIGMKLFSLLIGAGIIVWSWIHKVIVFDFRRNYQKEIEPVVNGVEIEIVTENKYLGTYIDNQLNWNVNTHKLCSKANQRIYFLRKLKLFNIDLDIMMFYQSVIQSVVMFYSIAWLNGLTVRNLTKLNRVTKSVSKIIALMLTM